MAVQALCNDVLAKANAPWARLALVRAQLHRGDVVAARKACEALVAEEPTYADAQDTLGRIHLESGDVARALAAFRAAVEMTPGCLLRAQACGTLAFYAGESKLAAVMLDRCVSLGIRSRLFDALTLLILNVLRYDERNPKGAGRRAGADAALLGALRAVAAPGQLRPSRGCACEPVAQRPGRRAGDGPRRRHRRRT